MTTPGRQPLAATRKRMEYAPARFVSRRPPGKINGICRAAHYPTAAPAELTPSRALPLRPALMTEANVLHRASLSRLANSASPTHKPLPLDPTAPLDAALVCTIQNLDKLEKLLTTLEHSLNALDGTPSLAPPNREAHC